MVVPSNKIYRVSIKDITALEKNEKRTKVKRLLYLEDPLLCISSEISTQFIRTNFLA